jgi:hypothetical protein
MQSISFKSLYLAKVFSTITTLRKNVNGYHFITLINKKGEANNLYFSKNSDAYITANYEVGEDITSLLVKSEVVAVENADGNLRHKISLQGSTEYIGASALDALFGVETEVDFNMADFISEFEAAAAPEPVKVTAKAGKAGKAGKKTV